MSPPLPPEIFDLIIDHLHDEPSTLKACCRVSKSWIPRSRGHLFACVEFNSTGTPIDLWMKAFPDPSNSPAHHTRTLCLRDPRIVSTDTRALIRSFCHVQTLSVNTFRWGGISLLPFHGLSPILKSLDLSEVHGSMSEIIGLICSFPLLEDLLFSPEILKTNTDGWAAPPTSPKLTGSLLLGGRNHSIVRELLNLPDGLHFSKIRVEWYIRDNDPGIVMDLVSRCSDTLETLYLRYYPLGAPPLASTIDQSLTLDPDFLMVPSPLDLSNATELKDLGFRWAGSGPRLETIAQVILSLDFTVWNLRASEPPQASHASTCCGSDLKKSNLRQRQIFRSRKYVGAFPKRFVSHTVGVLDAVVGLVCCGHLFPT